MVDPPLANIGLNPSHSFPREPYEAVHKRVASKYAVNEMYDHFSGAWAAVAYRYKASLDAALEFETSISRHGSTPSANERYHQDQALAEFFNSGSSMFEGLFYGLYSIGVFIAPSRFSLTTEPERKRVSPTYTAKAYTAAFPNDPILQQFDTLFDDITYREMREIRNTLTHRAAPGRRMFVGIAKDDAPQTEWKFNNLILSYELTTDRRTRLSQLLELVLCATNRFLERKAT